MLSAWLPVGMWAAGIFLASGTPDLRFVPDPFLDFAFRKIGHMAVFGILALLVWRALANSTSSRRTWAWALGLTIMYGASDELHQGVVTGRTAAIGDVAFDAAGALIAICAAALVRSWLARHQPVPS